MVSELTALCGAEVRNRRLGALRDARWPKGARRAVRPGALPPPPSLLADAPRPEPTAALPSTPPEPPGARGNAPTGPGSGLPGSRSPRPAPRPPASGTHGPLPRRYLAIPRRPLGRVGRRPEAARSPQSPGDWRRGGGGPGTTRRRRRRRLASPAPAPGCSRRPRAWGRPLPSASPGSRRRRQSPLEVTLTATAAAKTLQPGLRRAGAVPARRSAGGAAVPAPPPEPPRAPPPEAARAPPPPQPPYPLPRPAARVRRSPAGPPLGDGGVRRRAESERQGWRFRGESWPEGGGSRKVVEEPERAKRTEPV